jgi:hypothetical protein
MATGLSTQESPAGAAATATALARKYPEGLRRGLAWLALAPAWPLEVARGGFPGHGAEILTGEAVECRLREMEREGLIESRPGSPPWRGRWYSMNRVQRALFLNAIAESPIEGPRSVRPGRRCDARAVRG